MSRIYIAGPLFNTHERWYIELIATVVEQAGYTTFVPHRDAGLVDKNQPLDRKRIFRTDMAALDECVGCVALLTGADHDSGTCGEIGYMVGKGKPVIGITDDMRSLNNLIWGLCGEGEYMVRTLEELPPLLKRLIP